MTLIHWYQFQFHYNHFFLKCKGFPDKFIGINIFHRLNRLDSGYFQITKI